MTTDDHTADFKDLLAAYDLPDLTATPVASSATTSTSSKPSSVTSKTSMALDKHLQVEAKDVIPEKEEPASSVDAHRDMENGEHCTDPKNRSSSSSAESLDRNAKAEKLKPAAGLVRRSVKVARMRRKSNGSRGNVRDPILTSKLMDGPSNSASATLSALSTTDTMIKSIPDLFKKASIATESSVSLPNGPMEAMHNTKDPVVCNETMYCDVTYQISANALPPFEPLAPPPERFNMTIPGDGHRCLDCSDHFLMESSLTQHLQRRSVYITFSCSTCKKVLVFYNRCTLLGHVRMHRDRNQAADIRQATVSPLPRELIPCIQEQISGPQKMAVSPGTPSKNNPTSLISVIIPPNSGGLSSRLSLKGQKDDGKCSECEQQCSSFLNLREHFGWSQISPSENKTHCTKCNMICPSPCSLKAHERIHLRSKPFVCPECGVDVSDSWQDFQHHLIIECMHYSRTVGFKCSACSSLFLTIEQLRRHVLNNHSEAYYKCQACPMAFRAESTFDMHRKTVHFFDNLQCSTIRKCPLCEVVFQNPDVLQNHLENHFQEVLKTSSFIYSCTECGKLFDSKAPLGFHCQAQHPNLQNIAVSRSFENSLDKKQLKLPKKRTHSFNKQGRKLPCLAKKAKSPPNVMAEATKTLESNDKPRIVLSLKGQKSSGDMPEYVVKKVKIPLNRNCNASDTKPMVNCEDCGRTFQSYVGLRVHCQRSHPESYRHLKSSLTKMSSEHACSPSPGLADNEPPDLAEEQISRSDCSQHKATRERRSSSNVGLNTCGECGREFQTVHGCNVHRQRCHGPDNVKSKCAVCQEYLPDPHLMAEHGHRHLNEGTLVCTLCNNLAFSTKLALSRHIENHVANMKYPLDCFYCHEKLNEAEAASAHWKREHNLLSFQCTKCDCQYLYKKSLHRHLHNTHGEGSKNKLHQCRFCEGEFTKTSLLKKHLEDKHHIPEEDPDEPPVLEPQLPEERSTSPKTEPLVEIKTEAVSAEQSPSKPSSPEPDKPIAEVSGETYVCAKCNFRANSREIFLNHISVHKTDSDSFQCLECGTCFVVEPSLRKHLTCTHKIKDLDKFLTENGYVAGAIASNNGCGNAAETGHLQNGNGPGPVGECVANPLECNVCFAVLDNALSLKTHMRTHGMAFIRSKRNMVCHGNNNELQQDNKSSSTPTKNDA